MIVALVGSRSKILHHVLPENDPKQHQPNISLVQELLGLEAAPRTQGRLDEDCRVF